MAVFLVWASTAAAAVPLTMMAQALVCSEEVVNKVSWVPLSSMATFHGQDLSTIHACWADGLRPATSTPACVGAGPALTPLPASACRLAPS